MLDALALKLWSNSFKYQPLNFTAAQAIQAARVEVRTKHGRNLLMYARDEQVEGQPESKWGNGVRLTLRTGELLKPNTVAAANSI